MKSVDANKAALSPSLVHMILELLGSERPAAVEANRLQVMQWESIGMMKVTHITKESESGSIEEFLKQAPPMTLGGVPLIINATVNPTALFFKDRTGLIIGAITNLALPTLEGVRQ